MKPTETYTYDRYKNGSFDFSSSLFADPCRYDKNGNRLDEGDLVCFDIERGSDDCLIIANTGFERCSIHSIADDSFNKGMTSLIAVRHARTGELRFFPTKILLKINRQEN